MKKYLLALLPAIALGTFTSQADVFPESFETGTLEELGWITTAAAPSGCGWQIKSYASETTQFPKNLQAPPEWGEMTLNGLTKGAGFGVTEGDAPDIWAISPQFNVNENRWLAFLLGCNMVVNGASNCADSAKVRFEVVVSPTGATDAESFTDVLLSETYINLNKWKVINVDLSKYAGKDIRFAFRLVADEIAAKLATSNYLYIDGVQLLENALPDIVVESVAGINNGSDSNPVPEVTLHNNGPEINGIEIQVQVNDNEPVKEFANILIPANASVAYTFTSPVELSVGSNAVSVTALLDSDGYKTNNNMELAVSILESKELPFTLSEGQDGSQEMKSTASGTARVPDGWQFLSNANSWVYTFYRKTAFLYPVEACVVTNNPLRVNFETELTGESVKMAVYVTKNLNDFGEPVGECTLTQESPAGFVLIPPMEPGNYIIALQPYDGASGNQVVLRSLTIDTTTTLPDVELKSINVRKNVAEGTANTVTVEVANVGSSTATDVKISYSCAGNTVEDNIAEIESGATVRFTFPTAIVVPEGNYTVTAHAETFGDFNDKNADAETSFRVYQPLTEPYKESFENESETGLWSLESGRGGESTWYVADGFEFDGTHILALSQSSNAHDDWAISPAINIPAGWNGRLSYYWGAGGNSGSSVIKSYLVKESLPGEIASCTPLAEHATSGVNVEYASIPVSISEDGNYYIAFYAGEGKESMLIDDVRLDATPEVAATGAELSVVDADYELEPGLVTITGVNHGLTAISNVKVMYAINLTSGSETMQIKGVREDYPGTIAAGEQFTYTFATPVEFDKEGVYSVIVGVASDDDTDSKNNTYMGAGPEKLKTMQLPALWDNEYSDHLHGYILDNWTLGSLNTYSGNRSVSHVGTVKNGAGDMVIFNRVYLPAGTYDLSFFWKTMQNQDSEQYRQTFDIVIGDEPTHEAMTNRIVSFIGAVAMNRCHEKVLVPFTVEESGYYWLGVNCLGSGVNGNLTIDDLSIKERVADITLIKGDDEYVADFNKINDEWQFYHPNPFVAQQWYMNDGNGCLSMVEIEDDVTGAYKGSWLQAPSFLMNGKLDYEINAEVKFLPYESASYVSLENYLNVYRSDVDLPSEFTLIGQLKGDGAPIVYKPETDGINYLTLKPETHGSVEVQLKGFSVRAIDNSIVDSVHATSISVDGNMLYVPEGSAAVVYTLSGMKVAEGAGAIQLDNGIYMVKTDAGVVKVIIK